MAVFALAPLPGHVKAPVEPGRAWPRLLPARAGALCGGRPPGPPFPLPEQEPPAALPASCPRPCSFLVWRLAGPAAVMCESLDAAAAVPGLVKRRSSRSPFPGAAGKRCPAPCSWWCPAGPAACRQGLARAAPAAA